MPSTDAPVRYLDHPAVIASRPMRDLLERVQRIAASDASVLIEGESGSGKEIIARALHHYSKRSTRPWVDVNCAALPEHLIESELFGYERGAFSGADRAKPGLFEMAHTGTLLLDEIGEFDKRFQAKLLRVLDGAGYYRLGGNQKITADVRVLSSTNQDLDAAIRDGRFRMDLYHRLSEVRLRVPPLRERPEDILALADFFLEEYAPGARLVASAAESLLNYGWPGNVRELRNVVIGASLAALDRQIRASDLELNKERSGPEAATGSAANLEELERQTILRVLGETGGHQEKAAARLGISSRTLSRKLKSYGVSRKHEQPVA